MLARVNRHGTDSQAEAATVAYPFSEPVTPFGIASS
jgi:hypothetical protein